jgi:cell division cycle 20-like protein 1 (cofactor of APC complex)
MLYSVNSNELVSTHGFSMNAITIWDMKTMERVGTLRGHSYRVLFLARSPDGRSILTGSGDQTLRFWKVFPHCMGTFSKGSTLETRDECIR